MPEEEQKHSDLKSEIAENRPRDDEGHFISQEKIEEHEKKGVIDKLFSENVHYSKSQDDLLDVHVGNPLRKILLLLQDIKQQKALSVSMKASVGIMGIALVFGVFGVFGGGKILCDRGVQSQIGTIKVLNVVDSNPSTIPFLGTIVNYFQPQVEHRRTVLVREDNSALRLPFSKNLKFEQYENLPVIITGSYDSCGQTLTVKDQSGIEVYLKSK